MSVRFEVLSGTAKDGLDFAVTSSMIMFGANERRKPVPIEIADDILPEIEETFVIRLLNLTTGGAVIGDPSVAEITILPSDDPFGAFGECLNLGT